MAPLRRLAGVAAAVATTAAASQCEVAPSARSDCGAVGTQQADCEAKGCCWQPVSDAGAPWCFHPAASTAKCPLAYTTTGPPFDDAEIAKVRSYFLRNIDIQGSGAVVAAPDNNTGVAGSYFYHWMRDGALSMSALLHTSASFDEVQTQFQHYVSWVEKVQNQVDPNKVDVRTDPKYEIPSGVPYTDPWCRPQTDGPGLRAKTLSEYALKLLERGQQDFVRANLWTGSDSVKHGGLIKYDLDWVAANWRQEGCDLWEDLVSDDFFWGRYTMRSSLHVGADLAEKMGDSASAARYRAAKADIEATLPGFYNGAFVYESSKRLKDGAVIEAFNDGSLDDDLFAPLSKEVLGTVITLNDFFCTTYDINQKDTAANIPGILYGRYEGDVYHDGNPWVLLSATFAQLIYRQAAAAVRATSIDSNTYALLQKAYDLPSGLSGKALGDALLGAGDGVMLRIKHHVAPEDLHMAEQISRADGTMVSAKDLTWNYANVLKAVSARAAYVALAGEARSASALVFA